MSLLRVIDLFNSHAEFRRFQKTVSITIPRSLDAKLLANRAMELCERHEPKGDVHELRRAINELGVSIDRESFFKVRSMASFLAKTLFSDISQPVNPDIVRRIVEFDGPRFFFFGHTSFFDYIFAAQLVEQLGFQSAVMHVTGSITRGWISRWLKGFRAFILPMGFSPIQHRAYSWYCAALAEQGEHQALFARTSRYTVRSRDGILREPYTPHGVVSAVKATKKALVIPVAISYAAIPEDSHLTSPGLFPVLSMSPRGLSDLLPFYLGIGKPDALIRNFDGVFGDVSVDVGEPFELTDGNSLVLQRISHRAIEEIARNKLVHPSQLVAKAMQGHEKIRIKSFWRNFEQEVDNTQTFFKTRYRKEAPLHPIITSDLPAAIEKGVKVLAGRGALRVSLFRRTYSQKNPNLLRFYAYHADRRVYPLRGRNTMTIINAGAWGYTLALHIGMNVLKKPELSEHSVILYDSREDLVEKLALDGCHPWHFKEMAIPRSVRPEADLIAAVGDTSLVMVVTPSKYFHGTLVKVLEMAHEGADLVIATKGFIPETGLLPCQTAHLEMERLGKRFRISVLSGANLAHEIIQGGAGVTQIACEEYETFERLRPLIETNMFRVVHSGDVIGTTISAALKNVYAIGFGILEGSKRAPENFLATYATLVTAEIRNFGMLLGAAAETFDAESQVWMADLLATCRGGRSAKFGKELAEKDEKHGKPRLARTLLEQYRKKRIAVEGFEACRFAKRIASQRGFHPPILGEIYSFLHSGKQINVEEFMEKCLDALSHRVGRAVPSTLRVRTHGF